MSTEETITSWSKTVAGLLVDHGFIHKADVERSASSIAEEMRMLIANGGYPQREPNQWQKN